MSAAAIEKGGALPASRFKTLEYQLNADRYAYGLLRDADAHVSRALSSLKRAYAGQTPPVDFALVNCTLDALRADMARLTLHGQELTRQLEELAKAQAMPLDGQVGGAL